MSQDGSPYREVWHQESEKPRQQSSQSARSQASDGMAGGQATERLSSFSHDQVLPQALHLAAVYGLVPSTYFSVHAPARAQACTSRLWTDTAMIGVPGMSRLL